MKFFTLTLGTVLPGASGRPFDEFVVSDELLLSGDCVKRDERSGEVMVISKASVEKWGELKYLVPERSAGAALVAVDFFMKSCDGFELSPQLLRLERGQKCRIVSPASEARRLDCWGLSSDETKPDIVFDLSFSGCFLRVERNGVLMAPDEVIA